MRIASVNFYVFNQQPHRDAALLRRLNLDVIGFQEAHQRLFALRRGLPEHRVVKAKGNNSPGAREVAVAVKRHKYLNHNGREVSPVRAHEETAIFKSRWITVVKYKHNGKKFAHINYHGNAALQSRRTGLLLQARRVSRWLAAQYIIQKKIKKLQRKGFLVTVTGDFNYRRFPRSARFALHYWSPQKVFRRTGLAWVERGIDYVAWPKQFNRKSTQIVSQRSTGADHDWLIVDIDV